MKKWKKILVGILCVFAFVPCVRAEEMIGKIAELFPDEVLAKEMRHLLPVDQNDCVTKSALESITFLDINGYEDWLGVKDWTGIRLLTNLESIEAQGQYEAIFNLEEVENLEKLESLTVYSSTLIGDLEKIADMDKLKILRLGDIEFKEEIEYILPENLVELQLSCIKNASGMIELVTGLKDLESVYLDENGMTGNISGFSALDKLKELHIREMDVQGELSAFSGLIELERLEIENTKISGSLSKLSALAKMKFLTLGSCSGFSDGNELFTGEISSFSGMTDMISLQIAAPNVTGELSDLLKMTNLKWLNFWVEFTDDVATITALKNLESINLRSGEATCTLDDRFSALTNLIQFVVCNVEFTGDLSVIKKIKGNNYIYLTGQYTLPAIEFKNDEPIQIDVPQFADYLELIPDGLSSKYDTYSDGKIAWNFPKKNVSDQGGEYSYYAKLQYDNGDGEVYESVAFQGYVIQPYTKQQEHDVSVLPQTGDNSHMALWLAMLTLSGIAMFTINRKYA